MHALINITPREFPDMSGVPVTTTIRRMKLAHCEAPYNAQNFDLVQTPLKAVGSEFIAVSDDRLGLGLT